MGRKPDREGVQVSIRVLHQETGIERCPPSQSGFGPLIYMAKESFKPRMSDEAVESQSKLPSAKAGAKMKKFWADALDCLKELIE